jgi:hypothetical protein
MLIPLSCYCSSAPLGGQPTQRIAAPTGRAPGNSQCVVGWADAVIEPGTGGLQPDVLGMNIL